MVTCVAEEMLAFRNASTQTFAQPSRFRVTQLREPLAYIVDVELVDKRTVPAVEGLGEPIPRSGLADEDGNSQQATYAF